MIAGDKLSSPQVERRKEVRRPLLIGVRAVPKEGKPRILGEFVDLSPTGAKVILMSPFTVGTDVCITLDRSIQDEWVQFEGKIVWSAQVETGFAHGVELVDLPSEIEQLIRELTAPPA